MAGPSVVGGGGDSLLLFFTLIAMMALGQPFSPHVGILVFLIVPAVGLLGFVLCWVGHEYGPGSSEPEAVGSAGAKAASRV